MTATGKLDRRTYESELERLQLELVQMLEWIRHSGHRLVVIFEGRDAAGKGSTISRMTGPLNPRACRVVALPKPSERESTEWYFQRYVAHLPSAGEMVVFDRSWYNRAGVERVLGFCSDAEYWEFLRSVPEFERMLVRSGIQIVKYWFSVSDDVQTKRFEDRLADPAKRWKFSDIDARSQAKWNEYSRAKDIMVEHTSIPEAQWWEVDGDDKRPRPTQHHQSPAVVGPAWDGRISEGEVAGGAPRRGVRAATSRSVELHPADLLGPVLPRRRVGDSRAKHSSWMECLGGSMSTCASECSPTRPG